MKPNLGSTSTIAARSERGEATAGSVAFGDLSDSEVPDRGFATGTGFWSVAVGDLSDSDVPARGLVSNPPGVSLERAWCSDHHRFRNQEIHQQRKTW